MYLSLQNNPPPELEVEVDMGESPLGGSRPFLTSVRFFSSSRSDFSILRCTCSTCVLFFSQLLCIIFVLQLQKQRLSLCCCGGLDYPRSWSFLHWPISHFISSLEFQPSSLLCLCLFLYTFFVAFATAFLCLSLFTFHSSTQSNIFFTSPLRHRLKDTTTTTIITTWRSLDWPAVAGTFKSPPTNHLQLFQSLSTSSLRPYLSTAWLRLSPVFLSAKKATTRSTPPDFNASPEYTCRACLYPSLSFPFFRSFTFWLSFSLLSFSILIYLFTIFFFFFFFLSSPHPPLRSSFSIPSPIERGLFWHASGSCAIAPSHTCNNVAPRSNLASCQLFNMEVRITITIIISNVDALTNGFPTFLDR